MNSSSLVLAVVALQALVIAVLATTAVRQRRSERAARESSERFRRIADRAPVIIWTARPDTTLDFVNQTGTLFTGMSTAQLCEEGWLDAVHPEDVERCMAIYVPAVEARKPFLMEYRLRGGDGVYRWVMDTGVPKYRPDGSYEGFIGTTIDITLRRDVEDQIRESRSALEVSHREIQDLAGRLLTAHEDERRRLALELHDDLTQRLARLAIDAGRLEQGPVAAAMRQELARLSEDVHALSYRLHPSVLDDLGLVEALRTECDRVARNTTLHVELETQDVPDLRQHGSALCLFRIAQEALSNAVRHASASKATVLLSPSGDGLQLAVSDDGSGFDPAQPKKGPSLGLASMRERVRLVDGRLRIDSAPGRGTTVVAWVPT